MSDIHYRIEHPTYLIKGIMLLFLAIFGNFVNRTCDNIIVENEQTLTPKIKTGLLNIC